jgi:hypothetical protein
MFSSLLDGERKLFRELVADLSLQLVLAGRFQIGAPGVICDPRRFD